MTPSKNQRKDTEMKIRDMFNLEHDIDMCDDYADDWCIAFCGWGSKPTKEGWEEFKSIWDLEVSVGRDYGVVKLNHLPDGVVEDVQAEVKRFFYAHAGYCADSDYNRWFADED